MSKVVSTIFLSVLLGATCLLSWYGLTEGHDWGGDFSAYIMQAQSVWQGNSSEFLQTNRFIIEESSRLIGPIAYPWGFPVLLAPFYAFFGLNMLALKSLNIVCYLIFIISLWLGFRRHHSHFWRVILVCFFALNPYFLRFMNNVVSDIPFLVFSTFSVLLIGRVVIQRRRLVSKISDQFLLGVLIAISFFIRTQGILILAALGVAQFISVAKNTIVQQRGATGAETKAKNIILRQFFSRSSNSWIFILPHVSFVIVTLLWRNVLPEGGSSHISLLNNLSLGLIKHHLLYYFSLPAELFAGVPASQILYGASIPLAIIGMFKRRDSDYHIIIYGVMTIFLLIVWPPTQGLRFLFPLLPFYVSFALTGLETCRDISHGLWNVLWKIVIVCPVIIIIIFFLRFSITDASENLVNQRMESSGPYLSTSKEVFSFISNNTETDDIIVFRKPRVMRLFTNRQSIMTDQVDNLTKGDYLCISLHPGAYHQIRNYDVVSLRENGRIHLVYQNMDFQLYQIKNRRSQD